MNVRCRNRPYIGGNSGSGRHRLRSTVMRYDLNFQFRGDVVNRAREITRDAGRGIIDIRGNFRRIVKIALNRSN